MPTTLKRLAGATDAPARASAAPVPMTLPNKYWLVPLPTVLLMFKPGMEKGGFSLKDYLLE